MYLGYEEPVAMPSMGVYDTDLMKAYIAGVKELYDNARLDMKDFNKLYGDFYSPIAGDTLNYYNLTVGGANKLIDDLMAQGIDPYKNPLARNLISRYIANVPTDKLNQMKQSAENAKAYIDMRGRLQAAGKWNPDYERYILGGRSLEDWDTTRDGMWTRTSPSEYQDIFDATNPWFKDMKDSYLYTKNGYDYTGVTKDQMKPILDQTLSDYLKSDLGGYHYSTFKDAYKAVNPNASEQDVMNKFKDEILNKNERIVRTNRDVNEYSKINYENRFKSPSNRRTGNGNNESDGDYLPMQASSYNWLMNSLYDAKSNKFVEPTVKQIKDGKGKVVGEFIVSGWQKTQANAFKAAKAKSANAKNILQSVAASYSQNVFNRHFGGKDNSNGKVYLNEGLVGHIYDPRQILEKAYGGLDGDKIITIHVDKKDKNGNIVKDKNGKPVKVKKQVTAAEMYAGATSNIRKQLNSAINAGVQGRITVPGEKTVTKDKKGNTTTTTGLTQAQSYDTRPYMQGDGNVYTIRYKNEEGNIVGSTFAGAYVTNGNGKTEWKLVDTQYKFNESKGIPVIDQAASGAAYQNDAIAGKFGMGMRNLQEVTGGKY